MVALIIGAQPLLWFTSGALMSFLPIDRVHGDHLVERNATTALPSHLALASPSAITAATAAPVDRHLSHVAWPSCRRSRDG